jgi:HIV Tat-specific factor 1
VAREERRAAKKRKKEENAGVPVPNKKPARPTQAPAAPKRTAVWVTSLPPTTTIDRLEAVFSKAGVLLVGDDGAPRIKLYYDDEGRFKGEALVMYFKEGSVDLAVRLLDETELEMGEGMGVMRVRVAEYDHHQKDAGKSKEEQNGEKRKEYTAEEKARMTKRIRALQECVSTVICRCGRRVRRWIWRLMAPRWSNGLSSTQKLMNSKVTWHETDDAEDAMLGPAGGPPQRGDNRMNRVVVLKYMFKLEDLDKDPALLLELKEDVREEAESFGDVTSVILYDVSGTDHPSQR